MYLACCDLLVHEFHSKPSEKEEEKISDKDRKVLNGLKFISMCFGGVIVISLAAVAPAHEH